MDFSDHLEVLFLRSRIPFVKRAKDQGRGASLSSPAGSLPGHPIGCQVLLLPLSPSPAGLILLPQLDLESRVVKKNTIPVIRKWGLSCYPTYHQSMRSTRGQYSFFFFFGMKKLFGTGRKDK